MNWKLLAKSMALAALIVGLGVFHGWMCGKVYDWFGYGVATAYNFGTCGFIGITGLAYTLGKLKSSIK